jgi:hypothetical protein
MNSNTSSTEQTNTSPVLDAIDGIEPLIREIKTSKSKIDEMESALTAEKQRLRALFNHFKTVEAEIRGIAGIVDDTKPKRRKPKSKAKGTLRPPAASIAGGASRVIRQAKEDGKDRKEAVRLATETASACAKKKHNMSKLGADVVQRIEAAADKHYGTTERAAA